MMFVEQPRTTSPSPSSAASRWPAARCRSATCRPSSSTRGSSPSRSRRWPTSSTSCSRTAASAERVFELLDETEEEPDPAEPVRLAARQRPRRPSRTSRSATSPTRRSSSDINLDVAAGPDGGHRRAYRRRQDHAGQPAHALLRDRHGAHHAWTGSTSREMRRGDLRRMFGMVLQDTWLFSGTIRENIAYGARRRDRGADAARRPGRRTWTTSSARCPDGYDTVLNEERSNISQGEKQLLTIARAFLADPAILILDEATSSVDTRTEVLIQKAMAALMRGPDELRHRPPALDHPRRRHDPRDGRTARSSSRARHEELLEQHGFYCRPVQQPVRRRHRRGLVSARPVRSARGADRRLHRAARRCWRRR